MPFKLRLKKSRHYSVISKSLFVVCVELLDGITVECSLSADSLGSECLEYVANRLGLQQFEFFGLCYMSGHGNIKWVEMDRPLKRQIDKHARDQTRLYLRVMYYIRGVGQIHDETTRYHYFLQVKKDVIDGRITCSIEDAIHMASVAMQAEFGNHDIERHTAEYLKDFVIFPQHLMNNIHMGLFEAVIQQHAALVGMPQSVAEERYILMAQQLDGYGQETFLTKDDHRNTAIVGISLNGVAVGYENSSNVRIFPWKEISNVINHKKHFGVECQTPEDNIQLELPDPESAKYVWKLCVLQHMFYMRSEEAAEALANKTISEAAIGSQIKNSNEQDVNYLLTQTGETRMLSDSVDELDRREPSWRINNLTTGPARAQSTSCLDLTSHAHDARLRALLPSYRPAPDYETAIQHKYIRQHSQQSTAAARSNHQLGLLYSSQPEIHQPQMHEAVHAVTGYHTHYPDVTQVTQAAQVAQVDRLYIEDVKANLHTYSTPELDNMESRLIAGLQLLQLYKAPLARPNSNSTPDLASQTYGPFRTAYNPQVSGSSPDLVSSRTLSTNNFCQPYQQPNPEAHRTYANLAALNHQVELNSRDVPVAPYRTTAKLPRDNSEPIYENIPLPWSEEQTRQQTRVQLGPDNKNHIVPENKHHNEPIHSGPDSNNANHNGPENMAPNQRTDRKGNCPVADQDKHMNNINLAGHDARQTLTISLNSSNVTSPDSVDDVNTDSSLYLAEKSSSTADNSSLDASGKTKTWKRWGLLTKGKSNTLQKPKLPRHRHAATREQPHRWSTGLPRLPLPPTVSKETMCQLLERKLADSQLFYEFEKIPKKKMNADFTTAMHPDNSARNRHKDVLPYEENRVRLTSTKENRMGYVNASHITSSVGNKQRFYVAAQGPLPNTIDSFWQTVWEADVYLLVRLTSSFEEAGFTYLPNTSDHCLQLGEYQIWKEFSQETGHCMTSRLRLTNMATRRSRAIWHLQYSEWAEHGCPSSPSHFLGFLQELNSVRLHTTEDIPAGLNRNPPVLVHCSAGVGRTGVTILCDLLLYTLDHNQEVDIPRVVALLRHQRMLMVQTVAQYRFIYSLLISYLKQSRLI